MKRIFRNNQVIITSLAIMIAIAGYLNFTNESTERVGVTSEYYKAEGDFKGGEIKTNESDGSAINNAESDLNEKKDSKIDNGELGDKDNMKDDNKKENSNEENNDKEIVVSQGEVEGEMVEVGTENNSGDIGEAVMVNSTASMNYFYNAKLNREQARAKNKEDLIEVVENTAIDEDKKEAAVNKIIELTANSERENAAEMMLKARGFDNSVVSIVDGKADVIVDAKTITEEEVAQIVDIVNRKTGIENKNIVVTPVNSK
ncbi:MAG: SpoIIIAH-like family protein [Lachnospiraceae bacterium]|nr:SpoIIIAH-like family protein [Lachnospiraceae bacterium]